MVTATGIDNSLDFPTRKAWGIPLDRDFTRLGSSPNPCAQWWRSGICSAERKDWFWADRSKAF